MADKPKPVKPAPVKPVSSNDRINNAARVVLRGKSKRSKFANLLPFLGPAFIASVAYVDPGNFATNIAGGAQFGLTLLWVIVASNLMAVLIQSLSAKLGHCHWQEPGRTLPRKIPEMVRVGLVGIDGIGRHGNRPG